MNEIIVASTITLAVIGVAIAVYGIISSPKTVAHIPNEIQSAMDKVDNWVQQPDISSPILEIVELFKARPQDFVITGKSDDFTNFKHVSLPINGQVCSLGRIYIHGLLLTNSEAKLLFEARKKYLIELTKKQARNRDRINKAIKELK